MNNLMTYLCNYAFSNGIAFILDTKIFKPEDVSFANGEDRRVFINLNWAKKEEIPFQFAHEISHILNGDTGSNSFSSNSITSKEEFAANKRAAKILLEYCDLNGFQWTNVINFMNAFSIPKSLTYAVKEAFCEYFDFSF